MDTSLFLPRRLLALEWDAREARAVVALKKGRQVEILHALAIDLRPRDAAQAAVEVNIGERIGAALKVRHIGQCETLVAVGRASTELRKLSVPPAPAAELPDLVRFQAQRQFTGLGDDWPLDYVPLEKAGDAESVLAAAIAPELVEQIRGTCTAAGQSLRRIVLRPFGAAALWHRRNAGAQRGCQLMVDLLAEEADLTVLIDEHVVFLRTVRLGTDESPAEFAATLLGEVRRTMGAAQNQLGGRRVESLVLCGDSTDHALVKAELQSMLDLPITLFDPFEGVARSGELAERLPEHSGRYAPLVGMLLEEAAGERPAIDFLHPRQRPTPVGKKRLWSLIGGAAAAVMLALLYMAWARTAALDKQKESLTQQWKNGVEILKRYDAVNKDARELRAWSQGDIIWLDELRELSHEAPPGDDVILSQLVFTSRPGEGAMDLEGRARSPEVHNGLVTKVSDERHRVNTKGVHDAKEKDTVYVWEFQDSVKVAAPGALEAPRTLVRPPAKGAAAKGAAR